MLKMNYCLRYSAANYLKAFVVICLSVGVLTARASADLKIVANVNVVGLPSPPGNTDVAPTFPITYTTYFQNEKSRVETSDGRVYIFNNDKDTVYQIDPKLLTFRTGSIKQLEDVKSLLPQKLQKRADVDSNLYVGSSVETQTYLSVETTRVPLSGDAHITIEHGPYAGHHGGDILGDLFPGGMHYGGGSRGGAWNGGSEDEGPGIRYPAYNVTGSLWDSSQYPLPRTKHSMVFPLAIQLLWGGAPLAAQLTSQIDQSHEIPLHADITVQQTSTSSNNDGSNSTPQTSIETTFDVESIATDNLDPLLFVVPQGYVKDDRPIVFPELALPLPTGGTTP